MAWPIVLKQLEPQEWSEVDSIEPSTNCSQDLQPNDSYQTEFIPNDVFSGQPLGNHGNAILPKQRRKLPDIFTVLRLQKSSASKMNQRRKNRRNKIAFREQLDDYNDCSGLYPFDSLKPTDCNVDIYPREAYPSERFGYSVLPWIKSSWTTTEWGGSDNNRDEYEVNRENAFLHWVSAPDFGLNVDTQYGTGQN